MIFELMMFGIAVAIICIIIYLMSSVEMFKGPREYVSTKYPDYADAQRLMDRLKDNMIEALRAMKRDLDGGTSMLGYYDTVARQLLDKFTPDNIYENVPGGKDTSFVIDKSGREFAICLRSADGMLHDYSTLQFVIYHEMSHIAVKTIGHGDEFWDAFGWLLKYLEKRGLYAPINYAMRPVKYCGDMSGTKGVLITYNPYYDRLRHPCPMLDDGDAP
jgi:hypothetical protein